MAAILRVWVCASFNLLYLLFVIWFLLCFNCYVESYESTDPLQRIVGGEPANITDFPYQLAMEVFVGTKKLWWYGCGASIIRRSWAITAAHCVYEFPKSLIRLRCGSSYIMRGGTLHYPEKIIIHPLFYIDAFENGDYDVAIIKVSTPFHYSDVTQRIPMACKTPSPGAAAVVSGWGYTNTKWQIPDQLQQLSVYIVEYEECKRAGHILNISLTPRFLCASVPEGGKNVFSGDSGGPLVVDNILVGIVSFGDKYNFLHTTAAYTDVAKLRTWVTESIQQESIHN